MTRLRAVFTLASVVLLTGCASGSTGANAPESEAPTLAESATSTPTPTVMTIEQAGEAYLDGVCPANAAAIAFNTADSALDAAGEGADIEPLRAAAVTLQSADQAGALAFSDPNVVWPESVRADIATITNYWYRNIGEMNGIVQAPDYASMVAVGFGGQTDEEKAAGPRLRTTLGLPLDTATSCEGR